MNKLDSKSIWIFFCEWFLPIIIPLAFLIVGLVIGRDAGEDMTGILSIGILVVIAYTAFSFFWAKLSYHYYRYELTELGFRKESGVIWKKYVTIPYARIQNVDINRGILARILGLSDLHIQTAGIAGGFGSYGMAGMGSEGRLPGLSKEEAEKMRDELVRRASKQQNQGV